MKDVSRVTPRPDTYLVPRQIRVHRVIMGRNMLMVNVYLVKPVIILQTTALDTLIVHSVQSVQDMS
jgi:hypothetical protein